MVKGCEMRKLFLICLVSVSALAGERLLGVIESRSATKSNTSSAPDGGQAWWDGGYDMPFCIQPMSLLTIQCGDSMSICTDLASCTAQRGVEVNASSLFLTSVGGPTTTIPSCHDAGCPVPCAQVSILVPGTDDGGRHFCSVFERTGKE